jgi:hypothetical protein
MWLAAAAAVVFALAIGSTSIFWRNADTQQAGPAPAVSSPAVLTSWDFEDGMIAPQTVPAADVPTPEAQPAGESALFTSDLESGDLSGWSTHS